MGAGQSAEGPVPGCTAVAAADAAPDDVPVGRGFFRGFRPRGTASPQLSTSAPLSSPAGVRQLDAGEIKHRGAGLTRARVLVRVLDIAVPMVHPKAKKHQEPLGEESLAREPASTDCPGIVGEDTIDLSDRSRLRVLLLRAV